MLGEVSVLDGPRSWEAPSRVLSLSLPWPRLAKRLSRLGGRLALAAPVAPSWLLLPLTEGEAGG